MAADDRERLDLAIANQLASPGTLSDGPFGTQYLALYVAGGRGGAEQTRRLEELRTRFGDTADGRAAMRSVLDIGQSSISMMFPQERAGMRDAFRGMVEDGSWTGNDTRELVAGLAAHRVPPSVDGKLVGDEAARPFERIATYYEHLGSGAAADGARRDFVTATLDAARTEAGRAPGTSHGLDAAAAQVMGHQSAAEIEHELTALSAHDSRGVERFAGSALVGEAERINPQRMNAQLNDANRGDGLANTMNALSARITEARAAGHPDQAAETQLAGLFSGTMRQMAALRGTETERTLLDHDDRTGLRAALNGAMRSDFTAILAHNMRPNGEGLTTAGIETFATYARTEFGGDINTPGSRATARDAEKLLGTALGTMQRDAAATSEHGPQALRRDFGAATFGPTENAGANAAFTIGQLTGAVRLGVDLDVHLREEHARGEQAKVKDGLERVDTIATYASMVQPEAGPVLGPVGSVASALAKNVPLQDVNPSEHANAFREMQERIATELARSPRSRLAIEFENGKSSANTQRGEDLEGLDQQRYHREAQGSQRGVLPAVGGWLERPESGPPRSAGPEDVRSAVQAYNASRTGGAALMEPTDQQVKPWSGQSAHGTLLQLDDHTYALHVGRGEFRLLDLERDLHGQEPPVNQPVVIDRTGTVRPDAPAPQLQRTP